MKATIYNISKIIASGLLLAILVSNTAQPGIWNAGGSGSFKLLYPEDSLAYKKIQMQSESIYMQLYNGFAVVKGTYNFINTTDSLITIKVGYPINAVFPTTNHSIVLNEVFFDDLYKIKGSLNNQIVPLHTKPIKNDNWYVWELSFKPQQLITFTVHFIVNTNNAQTLQGYNKNYTNAFIYLIETGSLWKSPIEHGDFYLQLKDDLSIDDIKGVAPEQLFFSKLNNTLFFKLKNYGLTPDDNFIITYSKNNDDFNFKDILTKSDLLFHEIDLFSTQNQITNYKKITLKNPYEVGGFGNFLVSGLYFLIIFGIPILIGIVLLIVLYKTFKRRRKSDY